VSDLVECCPECGYHDIYARSSAPADERWCCRDCGHTFAEPAQRERRERAGLRDGGLTHGLAAQLAAEDVTEVEDIADAIGD